MHWSNFAELNNIICKVAKNCRHLIHRKYMTNRKYRCSIVVFNVGDSECGWIKGYVSLLRSRAFRSVVLNNHSNVSDMTASSATQEHMPRSRTQNGYSDLSYQRRCKLHCYIQKCNAYKIKQLQQHVLSVHLCGNINFYSHFSNDLHCKRNNNDQDHQRR